MRILLLADIHANRAALEAIWEPHDVCVCLGDIVDYGPDPGWCVDWVRGHAHHAVRGNHDHGAAQNVEVQGTAGFRFLTAATRPHTVAALTPDQRRYLAGLPTSKVVALGGKRFLFVHATPRDPMDEYGVADPEFWAPRVAGLGVDFVCCGHTHQPYTLSAGSVTVVNPGSVGLTRDGDPRAAYAVIEDGRVRLERVAYQIERTAAAVQASRIDPHAKQMLCDLYRGGLYVSRKPGNGSGNGNGHPGPPTARIPLLG